MLPAKGIQTFSTDYLEAEAGHQGVQGSHRAGNELMGLSDLRDASTALGSLK